MPRPILPPLRRRDVLITIALAALVLSLRGDAPAPLVQGAWFFTVVGLIWGALQTVWQVTSTALSFALRWTLASLRWGITNLGKAIATGLSRAAIFTAKALGVVWRALRGIFEPVFRVIGRAIDKLAGFLRRIFRPVLEWLERARFWVNKIYQDYVRPILDVIDLTRQIFRLLGALGLDWARAIDRALGRVSSIIRLPFDFIIGKINEMIGIINRIVTLNGLLQRLTLMRSLIRDVSLVSNLFHNAHTVDLSPGEIAELNLRNAVPHPDDADRDLLQYLETRSGPLAAKIDELVAETLLIARGERVLSGEGLPAD